MSKRVGIDLGTDNSRVIVERKGIVCAEPTLAAVDLIGGPIYEEESAAAYGADARLLASRTPGNVRIAHPYEGDAVPERDILRGFIKYLMERAGEHRLFHPDLAVSISGIPDETTEQLIVEAATDAGARDVYLIDTLKAASVGAGINVYSDVGIVNIGAAVTDMAVYSHGKIVASSTCTTAGRAFTQAIRDYVWRSYKLNLTPEIADKVKLDIASLHPVSQKKHVEVTAMRQRVGLPRSLILKSTELVPALEVPLDDLVDRILALTSSLSFELDKIVLSGGGAKLEGLPESIEQLVGIRTELAPSPEDCVAMGIALLIDNDELEERE